MWATTNKRQPFLLVCGALRGRLLGSAKGRIKTEGTIMKDNGIVESLLWILPDADFTTLTSWLRSSLPFSHPPLSSAAPGQAQFNIVKDPLIGYSQNTGWRLRVKPCLFACLLSGAASDSSVRHPFCSAARIILSFSRVFTFFLLGWFVIWYMYC